MPPEPVQGGLVGEGGIDGGAADALHRMRQCRAGHWIRVGADLRLRQQVADGIVGEGFDRCDVLAHRRRGEAVEGVVGQRLYKPVLD